MAEGRSVIENVLFSDDTLRMLEALKHLGFQIAIEESDKRVTVNGLGGKIPPEGFLLDRTDGPAEAGREPGAG